MPPSVSSDSDPKSISESSDSSKSTEHTELELVEPGELSDKGIGTSTKFIYM